MSTVNDHDNDIYRGDPPPSPPASSRVSLPSEQSTFDSASSSSASFTGGRLGALAAKVEHAISRWARNVRGNSSAGSDSSTSSSSSSLHQSSIMTLTRSQQARRRRKRPSISSLRTLQSERDIAARIVRLKALEVSRRIPRMFTLYLPPSIISDPRNPSSLPGSSDEARNRRITLSTSLPHISHHLELAMHRSTRSHHIRNKHKATLPVDRSDFSSPSSIPLASGRGRPSKASLQVPVSDAARKRRKGKGLLANTPRNPTIILEEPVAKPQAWFLDVANPTWADLRALGKLLHIHPLTLEDILQQDPREKLEIFTKLGYYFISFRAIESETARKKIQRGVNASGNNLEEGSIGEANVYLTVFNDGICCFHFTDVSEHTDRVRSRIVLLEEVVNMSSDWIAYDILDSIVDSFFPFLEQIGKEVMAIENLVFSGSQDLSVATIQDYLPPEEQDIPLTTEKLPSKDIKATDDIPEKQHTDAEKFRESFRPRFEAPRPTISMLLRRYKRFIDRSWKYFWSGRKDISSSTMQLTLRRIARSRKLVTSLGRLLTAKSDVITQIRKRMSRSAANGNSQSQEEFDIAIYMGDIQDHILTLQNALAHYERVLGQSHPTYIVQLRASFETTKAGTDIRLLYLSIVSVSGLCIQTIIGIFSMNVTVPHNYRAPGGHYYMFGTVLCLAGIVILTLLLTVRHWWNLAKRRRLQIPNL